MTTDFIVIGSGLSGLTSALILSEFGQVILVTKGKLTDSATNLAQGGIAAVVTKEDSFGSHIKDTLVSGCFHNKKNAVRFLVESGPKAINWLVSQGIRFATNNGEYSPTLEAAHSYARVLHTTDITGREIEKVLTENVRKNKNITVWENSCVTELIVNHGICNGCAILQSDKKIIVFAKATILATGGLGQLYEWTTNPKISTGDGIALAANVGAKITDMEFIQFHPTALKPACGQAGNGISPLFLLSEALRGEGAYLVKIKNQKSKIKNKTEAKRFMKKYDKRGELAPRDIVARAIYNEQQMGYEVFLDIRHKGKEYLQKRFPGIFKELERRGYDLSSDLIPVTPAAHYCCGGVKVDLFGRTSIRNLFAFGEVSCTGVQGANRLASNSLLEAVVFPLRLKDIADNFPNKIIKPKHKPIHLVENKNTFSELKTKLKKLMWKNVGIVRTKNGLIKAMEEIEQMEVDIANKRELCPELFTIRNMLAVARIISRSAFNRPISLGAHYLH